MSMTAPIGATSGCSSGCVSGKLDGKERMSDLNYIAKCKRCDRLVGAISGELPADEQARYVARWIKSGELIEQMSTEDVRKAAWGCKCPKAEFLSANSRRLFSRP